MVSWLSIHAGAALATAAAPGPGEGPLAGSLACYRVYRTADERYLTVGAVEPRFWQGLCEVIDFRSWPRAVRPRPGRPRWPNGCSSGS